VLVPAKVQDDILSDITRRTTIHGQVMADNLTTTLDWGGADTIITPLSYADALQQKLRV